MANPALLTYPERLETFTDYWQGHEAAARQLAAIGHIYDRPPLEVLEDGSRCISCSAFVKKESSIRALESSSRDTSSYEDGFETFNFHHPSCTRLQVRIPLDPQAILPGLHGGRINDLRRRFEKRPAAATTTTTPMKRASQQSSLFSLPTELRLQIYAMILPRLESVTEILQLNRDSARVVTSLGYQKAGPRNTSKPNILRTCRAVNDEAMDLLYCHTTFKFGSTKVMYLFLRSIGKAGLRLIKSIDIHCGGREDAIAFAMLASCESLQRVCIRLPRPMILFPRAPIWIVDGMSCLLSLSGIETVTFGSCASSFNYMSEEKADAAVIRTQLTRPKDTVADVDYIKRYLNL